MPRLYNLDDKIESDGTSCSAVREDFRYCVMNCDCVKKDRIKPSECVKSNQIPEECQNLKTLLFECKRSLVSRSAASSQTILTSYLLFNRSTSGRASVDAKDTIEVEFVRVL